MTLIYFQTCWDSGVTRRTSDSMKKKDFFHLLFQHRLKDPDSVLVKVYKF